MDFQRLFVERMLNSPQQAADSRQIADFKFTCQLSAARCPLGMKW